MILHQEDSKPQGNTWGVPAGKVDIGERHIDAVVREIREETGYITNESELKLSEIIFVRYSDFDFTYHIYHHLLKKPHEIKINKAEHKDFEWVTPEDALKRNLIQDEDGCIRLFYSI